MAILVYVFLTSLFTAVAWKAIWAYVERAKRQQELRERDQ